ncbi:MAG: hypothetical protein GY716_16325 [bacterium]|nr:hypothetical protein [bacterium]
MRKTLFTTLAGIGVITLLVLLPGGEVGSQTIREVFVVNFPPVQQVQGNVAIEDPVALSELVRIEDIIVPPVRPEDTTRLVEAGSIETEGFPNVVLSLHGIVKGSTQVKGTVGAILLPEETTIEQAFNELGMVHFALQVSATGVSSHTPYFASNQPRYTVGFRSYKILLYNTTDKTVTANLFAYLTN